MDGCVDHIARPNKTLVESIVNISQHDTSGSYGNSSAWNEPIAHGWSKFKMQHDFFAMKLCIICLILHLCARHFTPVCREPVFHTNMRYLEEWDNSSFLSVVCKYACVFFSWSITLTNLWKEFRTLCVNSLHFVRKHPTDPIAKCIRIGDSYDLSVPELWQKDAWCRWKGDKRRNTNHIFHSFALWVFLMGLIRIGEATNPGPDNRSTELNIYHCNPTALIGKEHEVTSWGQGITLISETSATARAQKIIQANLRKHDLKTIWSKPVLPYRQSSGEVRGIAGGTAIISSYPIRKTLEPLPEDIVNSDRYTEAIVQISPGHFIFCVALYGAVIGQRYHDSFGITNRLFSIAAQRAVKFQGPAIIVGDLNCSLSQLSLWPSLIKHGWNDTALKSAELNHHSIEMTYNNITRHSFILTSGELKNALIDCRTIKHHVFSQHPVMRLRLNLDTIVEAKFVWQLPKSFDQFRHDSDKAQQVAEQEIELRHDKLEKCFTNNDMEGVARQWTIISEQTLKQSAVGKTGSQSKPKLGHLGRAKKEPIALKSPAIPTLKTPRNDHYIPSIDQGSVELRRHVKQLHRLQSLHSQIRALNQNPSSSTEEQAVQLWKKICDAKGFHVSFVHWMYSQGFLIIPTGLPDLEFLGYLKEAFHKNLRALECDFRLYKSKIKQLNIIEDLKYGAALAFREVKNNALPPLDEIQFEVQGVVKKVKWPKEGLTKLRLEGRNEFLVGQTFNFQNQEAMIVECQPERIVIDKPFRLRNNDYRITHKSSTADQGIMQSLVKEAWGKYFTRDPFDEDKQAWANIDRFLNLVESCPTMAYQKVTPDMLSNAIQTTKTKSARGSDGFTTMDLRKLPLCIWALLCRFYEHVEIWGGEWPGFWTLAKTLCLPKSELPKSPMDVRPITILSKTYRLWAKIRGKQIAQHLASMVPATIGGPCKGISSEIIAQFTSLEIENALQNHQKIQGMVLDLVKCYNAIPREPMYRILQRLGVNPHYLKAFQSMLANMKRTFEINGGIDPIPWKTSTGIVEGCGVAVSCMLALGIWCNSVIQACESEAQSIMFADNWAVITTSIQQLQTIINQIIDFLDALKMEMSPQKSWLWATDSSDRKLLKEIHANGQTIPIVHHAKDLGVDQVYSRKIACPTKRGKIRKTIQKMKDIQKAKLPKGARKRITVGAGLAIRTYGISTQLAAKAEYKHLRAATCAALHRTAGNASPWLALNTHDTNIDPQWRDITQAIQAWKRFLKVFPQQKDKLIAVLALGNHKIGAIGKLKAWCETLGWKFVADEKGSMQSGNRSFSWLLSPSSTFKKVVGRDWSKYVAANCKHRKYFDIQDIDTITLKKCYDKASYLDKRYLEHQFTGRAFTNDEISRFDFSNEGKCPACGLEDSRQHRLFQCKETKQLRNKDEDMIAKMSKSNMATWYHGIIGIPQGFDKHLDYILNIPTVVPLRPLYDATCCHLFLDGTAFFNNTGYWAIAGASVAQAAFGSYKVVCLDRALVPDVQQSSFHGELTAVALALNKAWTCKLYSDCQAVVDLVQRLLDAYDNNCPPPEVEHSIWRTIVKQVFDRPPNCIQIEKVKAHQNWKILPEGEERWKAYVNSFADKYAKQVITHDNAEYYAWLGKQVKTFTENAKTHEAFLNYACEVGRVFTNIQGKKDNTKCQNGSNFDLHHHCITRTNLGVERKIQIPRQQFLAFPWGPTFLFRIVYWARKLQWCKGPCKCTNDISMLELFFDYANTTGSLSPICLTPKAKRKETKDGKMHSCWEMPDISLEADMRGQLALSEHTVVFGRAMEFLIKNGNPLGWPNHTIPKTKSLGFVGLSTASRGFTCRPALVQHDESIQQLRNYLCTPKGMRRDLKSPYVLQEKPIETPSEYTVPYKERIPFLYQTFQSYMV